MTLNVNSVLCRQCYVYCDETAEALITQFFAIKYSTIYLSYLHINF